MLGDYEHFLVMDRSRIWGTLDPFIEGSLEGGADGRLVGRNVANCNFLKQLLAQDAFAAYHFFLGSAEQSEVLVAYVRKHFPELLHEERIRILPRTMLVESLRTGGYHCFHLSDCINYPAQLARLRNLLSPEIFPITSVTHSLSYARFAKDFMAQLWEGKTARDAIVATSHSAQQVVSAYFEYLRRGYGMDPLRFSSPEIPLIPLGVDTDAYAPAEESYCLESRQQLGVTSGQTLILVLGRLSHLSKLDVVPVLRAMQRIRSAGEDLSSFCLIMAGAVEDTPENLAVVDTYKNLAANLGLEMRIVKNPSDTQKHALLAAADVFLSPSDNLQETFGLTLLEAGACGLPVVASDFDGYRDLVEHGRTGFLVPTLGPKQSTLLDAQAGVLYDNQLHLAMAQQLVVDVPILARSLLELHQNPQLRQTMGREARELVCEKFSWQSVIERYCELWEELWLHPVKEESIRGAVHPLTPDYARIFASYPTRQFSEAIRVRWSASGQAIYRKQDEPVYYDDLGHLLDAEIIRFMLFKARKECAASDLAAILSETKALLPEEARAVVLWALKQDLLEICRDTASPSE